MDPAPLTESPFESFTRRVLALHRTVGMRYAPERLCSCGQVEYACVYLALASELLGDTRPGGLRHLPTQVLDITPPAGP